MGYNLVDQPFVFATFKNGDVVEVGLRELFARADEIISISGDTEIQEFPLMRVLISVLYGALPSELLTSSDSWSYLWEAGFDTPTSTGRTVKSYVEEYLTEHYSRFDLQGETPFMGVVGATYKKEDADTSCSNLFVDHITLQGLPQAHFSMRNLSFFKQLTPSVVSRALIEMQAYRVGSRKSIFVGDPRTSKVGYAQPGWTGSLGGMLLRADTLAETLLLNTPPYELLKLEGEDSTFSSDEAVWERPQDTIEPIRYLGVEEKIGKALGPKEILTHQPARVELIWNEDNSLVIGCKIGIGDRIFTQDSQLMEPHSTQYLVTAQDKVTKYWRPKKLGTSTQFWRGFTSLLAVDEAMKENLNVRKAPILTNYARNVMEIDLPRLNISYFEVAYGTQEAIVDDITVAHLTLPAEIYNDLEVAAVVTSATSKVNDVLFALKDFEKNVQATLASRPAAVDTVSDGFLFKAGMLFRSWVTDVHHDSLTSKKEAWDSILKELIGAVISEVKVQAPSESFFPNPQREYRKRQVLSVPEAEKMFWNFINKKKVFEW